MKPKIIKILLFVFWGGVSLSAQDFSNQMFLNRVEKSRNVWAIVRYHSVKTRVDWNQEFKFLYELSEKNKNSERFELELNKWVNKNLVKSNFQNSFVCSSAGANIDSLLSAYIPNYQFNGKYSNASLFDEKSVVPLYFSTEEKSVTALPELWERVLSLTKIEYYIRYFYPYYSGLELYWASWCRSYLLAFMSAPTAELYYSYIQYLLSTISDGHFGLHSKKNSEKIFFAPFRTRVNSAFAVIEKVDKQGYSRNLDLQIGDTIVEINGVEMENHIRYYAGFTPHSNPSNLYKRLDSKLFSDSLQVMSVTKMRNGQKTVTTIPLLAVSRYTIDYDSVSYELLSDSVAWVDLGLLKRFEVDGLFQQISEVKYLILDARSYPNATIDLLCSWLMPQSEPFVIFEQMSQNRFGEFCIKDTVFTSFQSRNPFLGRLILLTDAGTVSQGEYTILALKQHPNAIQIGTPTGGTLAYTTLFHLPGGVTCRMPVMSFNSPYKRYSQQKGIPPDVFSEIIFTKNDVKKIIELSNSFYSTTTK